MPGADKSLARPTSRCILFDGENISFHASLHIYIYIYIYIYIHINSTNIPPIMITNRIYENQNLLSLQLVSFLVGLRTYQHPSLYTPPETNIFLLYYFYYWLLVSACVGHHQANIHKNLKMMVHTVHLVSFYGIPSSQRLK